MILSSVAACMASRFDCKVYLLYYRSSASVQEDESLAVAYPESASSSYVIWRLVRPLSCASFSLVFCSSIAAGYVSWSLVFSVWLEGLLVVSWVFSFSLMLSLLSLCSRIVSAVLHNVSLDSDSLSLEDVALMSFYWESILSDCWRSAISTLMILKLSLEI